MASSMCSSVDTGKGFQLAAGHGKWPGAGWAEAGLCVGAACFVWKAAEERPHQHRGRADVVSWELC